MYSSQKIWKINWYAILSLIIKRSGDFVKIYEIGRYLKKNIVFIQVIFKSTNNFVTADAWEDIMWAGLVFRFFNGFKAIWIGP